MHHPTKDEPFVLLRDKVVVQTYNDDRIEIDSILHDPAEHSQRRMAYVG